MGIHNWRLHCDISFNLGEFFQIVPSFDSHVMLVFGIELCTTQNTVPDAKIMSEVCSIQRLIDWETA